MIKLHRLLLCILFPVVLSAQPDYSLYDSLLQTHVSSKGKVNYPQLRADSILLDSVIRQFQTATPDKSWSKDARLAYWINAYNLFTLDLIVSKYPVKKITQLDNGKTWDIKRIKIGDQKYSLNEIENEILRPQFKDARIHFAINCAARSCPPLHNRAFTPENVQSLLTQRTRKFVRSTANHLEAKEVEISKIFEWYAADFGDIIAFLNKYGTVSIQKDAQIKYKDYNWNLND